MTSKQTLAIAIIFACLCLSTLYRVVRYHDTNKATANEEQERKNTALPTLNVLKGRTKTFHVPDILSSPRRLSVDNDFHGSMANHRHTPRLSTRVKICVCALTRSKPTWKTLDDSRVMKNVIASTHRTTVMEWDKFEVQILLGADADDAFWLRHADALKRQALDQYKVQVTFKFYQKHANFLPFNDLMRDGYHTGSEYLVRINDDTEFTSKGWISLGVDTLKNFQPPNVGVVGPSCAQGNTNIMTHDMVHRTHLDIFKTYYPPVFHNWYLDDWISRVYGPARTKKIQSWTVIHHIEQQGQRYKAALSDSKLLHREIASGGKVIDGYLGANNPTPSASASCSLKPNVKFLSQSNEDKAMFEKFYKDPPKCAGTIVEIGALDGLLYSNSFFFERALNWKSVLVEANPQNAELLKQNRPDAITVHAAMCPEQNVKFQGTGAVGGVLDSMSQKHKDGWIRKQDPITTVPCRRWGPLFKEHNITHVDIFFIDVEGGEYSVLSVMDWEVHVDYFIIEMSSSSSTENQQRIVLLLASKGYTPVSWSLKDWCSPGNDCTSNTVFSKSAHSFPAKTNHPAQIIAYSLYGNNPRYTDGAVANAKLYKTIYPGWQMRVYHDDSVPEKILHKLQRHDVQLRDMSKSNMNAMSWRFTVTDDVARFCARDIDSRLSIREKHAVDEWIASGKGFHVMRDHPSHSSYALSGGMWCASSQGMRLIEHVLKAIPSGNRYMQDMDWLNAHVWPIAQQSVLQHDSFSCDRFGGGLPFPTPRVGWEHVGSVYINGQMREGDVAILSKTPQPVQCTRHTDAGKNEMMRDADVKFITNKHFLSLCDWAFRTRSRNDLKLPIQKDAILCVQGTKDVLDAFFKLDITTTFTLISIESDESVPQNTKWLENKYLKRWYSWNAVDERVTAIPIGLNHDSQLDAMTKAKAADVKIDKVLVNFKQDTKERKELFNKVKEFGFVQSEPYEKKWENANALKNHYETISKYKWVLCPRGAGQDTHRVWEALYLGAIPVVLKSQLSPLYQDLPIIQLNNWDELSWNKLQSLQSLLTKRKEKADFEYWARRIKEEHIADDKDNDEKLTRYTEKEKQIRQKQSDNTEHQNNIFFGYSTAYVNAPVFRTPLQVPEITWVMWFGPEMKGNRLNAFHSLLANIGSKVQLVTASNFRDFEWEGHPLHPIVDLPVGAGVSMNHLVDYLRVYFMHFYGGAYHDVKPHDHGSSYQPFFSRFAQDSNIWVIGSSEMEKSHVGCEESYTVMLDWDKCEKAVKLTNKNKKESLNGMYSVESKWPDRKGPCCSEVFKLWKNLVRNGAYMCRPGTPLTQEWLNMVESHLDAKFEKIKMAPSPASRCCNPNDKGGYPLRWAEVHGEAFGPVQAKYHEHVTQGLPSWGNGPYRGDNEQEVRPEKTKQTNRSLVFARGSIGLNGWKLQPMICSEDFTCGQLKIFMKRSFTLFPSPSGLLEDFSLDSRKADIYAVNLPVLFDYQRCLRIVVGIFTTNKESIRRARWTALFFKEGYHMLENSTSHVKCGLNFVFVLGRPANDNIQNAIILPCKENMNQGKSMEWQRQAATLFPTASYIAKMDSDTKICPSRIMFHIRMASRFQALMIGNPTPHECGPYRHCPVHLYFSGGFYAVHMRGSKQIAENMKHKTSELKEFNLYPHEDMNMGAVLNKININLGLPYYPIMATNTLAELARHAKNATFLWNQGADASLEFLPHCRPLYPMK